MSWRRARAVILLVIRPRVKMPPCENRRGEVREWSNRHAWKACVPAMGPWVRIPPSPPSEASAELLVLSVEFAREWERKVGFTTRESFFPLITQHSEL